MSSPLGAIRGTVLRGLAWNAGYQAFASLVQFAAMLVTVRLIPPEEYGHWVVAVGILQFLNAVNIASFLSHALQLPAGREPEWTLHWHAGNLFQLGLFLACNGIAIALRGRAGYEAVSVLLHIASVGLLFNTPAQLRMVMLQRRLDFRRLRILTAISALFGTGCIVLGAVAGYGARAMVLGGNVLGSLAPIVDLLVVEGWRPEGRWFAWPDLRRYRESFVFGATRVGGTLLGASRGVLNAAILPPTLGFGAIGLMNRAEALFAMSAGRVLGLLSDTAYPILPQVAGDEERFARVGRAYCLLMLALVSAAVGLFAACARDLSRLLYGAKWAAADPLLLPGAVMGLGVGLATVGSHLLLARGRLKHTFTLDVLPRTLVLPAFIGVIVLDWSAVTFYWTEAIGLVLTGVISLYWASRWLPRGAMSATLTAPAFAAATASVVARIAHRTLEAASLPFRTGVEIAAFGLVWLLVLRYVFPRTMAEMLDLMPGGPRLRRVLLIEEAAWRRS